MDELARQLNVARASFRMSPLTVSFWAAQSPRPNPLLKLGFSDSSLATQVIDLQSDELQLLRDMRKGHRADITRADRMLRTAVPDKESITLERFESYRRLHAKAAGRVTRPEATFRMMHDWIREGSAILCPPAWMEQMWDLR